MDILTTEGIEMKTMIMVVMMLFGTLAYAGPYIDSTTGTCTFQRTTDRPVTMHPCRIYATGNAVYAEAEGVSTAWMAPAANPGDDDSYNGAPEDCVYKDRNGTRHSGNWTGTMVVYFVSNGWRRTVATMLCRQLSTM